MDREAWRAVVHGVTKSRTWLTDWTELNWTILYYICARMLSCFSCVRLCAALWTLACRAPPSLGFSRQEFWSGLPCPPSGDLPDPGIKPASHFSCIGRPGFLPLCHLGSPSYPHMWPKTCFYAISWNSGRMHLICFPSFRDHVLSAYFPIAENCCIYLVWFFF